MSESSWWTNDSARRREPKDETAAARGVGREGARGGGGGVLQNIVLRCCIKHKMTFTCRRTDFSPWRSGGGARSNEEWHIQPIDSDSHYY